METTKLFDGLISHSVQLERQRDYANAPLDNFRDMKHACYGFISNYSLSLVEQKEKPLTYGKT